MPANVSRRLSNWTENLRVPPKTVHSETRTFRGNAWRWFPGREKSWPVSLLMLTTPPCLCGPVYAADLRLSGLLLRGSRLSRELRFVAAAWWHFYWLKRSPGICPSPSSGEAGSVLAAGRKSTLDTSLCPNTLQCSWQRDFDSHQVPLTYTGIPLSSLGVLWGTDSCGKGLWRLMVSRCPDM